MSGWMISLIFGIFKNGTDELIYITEQSHRCRKPSLVTRRGRKRGINWEIGIGVYILLCIKYIIRTYCISQGTLFNTLMTYIGKEFKEEGIYIYIYIYIYIHMHN